MTTATIVLVHGAWSAGWYWQPVAAGLRARGFDVFAVDTLPSASGDPSLGLAADTEFLRTLVAGLPGQAILVGHSYGGMVISQLAGDPSVAAAVYLSAFWPKSGESFIDTAGGKLARWIEVDETSGLTRIAAGAINKVVTAGLREESAASVSSRLSAQSLLSFTEHGPHLAWRGTPVTYIVCTEDRVIPEQVQRAMAANESGTRISEIATGHFPMFTAVDETVAAIAESATI